MSGKFTRMQYDNDAYDERIGRSTRPMNYRLDPNAYVNCNNCYAPNGPRGNMDNSVTVGNQIDLDSILRGLDTINTKINSHQMPVPLGQYKLDHLPICDNTLETDATRHSNPASNIRGLAPRDMRLDYPLHDPQCNIFENFQINTRLQAKDNHRAVWQVPMNQDNILPKEQKRKPRNCKITYNCGN